MNTIKKKQTHRYREQTRDYQWGKGSREGQDWSRGLEVQTIMYQIGNLQGYIIHHKQYSQYFIITVNRI